MDLIVWFIETTGEDEVNKTMVSAVTAEGVVALAALIFSDKPIYVIQIAKTPEEFFEGLPEGVVACLYIDGLLQELEITDKVKN